MRVHSSTFERGVTAAIGCALAASVLAASPPCAISPLWQYQDQANGTTIGPAPSDAAGNVYFLLRKYENSPGGETYQVLSLDQSGHLRFRTTVVTTAAHIAISDIALIGGNLVLAGGNTAQNGLTLVAYRASNGTIAWARNVVQDLERVAAGRIYSVWPGSLARGEGYLAAPLSFSEMPSSGVPDRRDALAAYDPGTGNLIGILQGAPQGTARSPFPVVVTLVVDEPGNLYLNENGSILDYSPLLTSWMPYGNFRYSAWHVSDLLAVGDGILVGGTNLRPDGGQFRPLQVLNTSDASLTGIGSASHRSNSPRISGNRLVLNECPDSPFDPTPCALTAYEISSGTTLWRVAGTGDGINPILTTAGSVVFLGQIPSGTGTKSAIREFDALGSEYVSCTIPSKGYTGFTLTGSRFVAWADDGSILGFDSYDHSPAAHGWVMDGGSPSNDKRPR